MKLYFSTNLKHLLMKKGLSQTDLAGRLCIKPQTVNRYIAGKIFPTIDVLILIGEIFNISLDDLVRKDLTDPGFLPHPAELYESQENIDKLTQAFHGFIEQLNNLKKEENGNQNQ